MVLLTQNELKEVMQLRDQIIKFANSYESVGSAALAIMDLAFGHTLPNGMDTRNCGWELGELASGMTSIFSEYMLDSEYLEMVNKLLSSEKLDLDKKYWLVCFLAEMGSDEEYHRFIFSHLFNIDYSGIWDSTIIKSLTNIRNTSGMLLGTAVKMELFESDVSDDWKERKINETMKVLNAGPIARRLVTYADNELLNADPIGAMDVVGERMEDILLDAEIHMINMSALFVAAECEKISFIPKTILPKGIAYFYKAAGQPADAYTASYRYVSVQEYENTKRADREITKRLKTIKKLVYDSELPALDPSTISHIPMSVWNISKTRPPKDGRKMKK